MDQKHSSSVSWQVTSKSMAEILTIYRGIPEPSEIDTSSQSRHGGHKNSGNSF